MKIFDYLKKEHDNFRDILNNMTETRTDQTDERRMLLKQLKTAILPHQHAEEEYFYQILLDETDEKADVYEDIEEHRSSRFVLSDLENTAFDNPAWEGICKVLKEHIEHHLDEEESDTFEIARQCIDATRAETVGKRFEQIEEKQRSKMAG